MKIWTNEYKIWDNINRLIESIMRIGKYIKIKLRFKRLNRIIWIRIRDGS